MFALFEFDNTTVVSRLIEGEYFKIDQMLSNDYETKVKVNKKELLSCIDRATLLVKEGDKKPIIINIPDNSMELKINTTVGSMNEGIDTGDMIAKKTVRLAEDETGGSLFDKLAQVGAQLCVETMDIIEAGKAEYIPQNNEEATHTSMIRKELGLIDWNKSAVEIERLIRGLNPWPSAYTNLSGKTFKIWKAKVVSEENTYEPGCICRIDKAGMYVQTGKGILLLTEVQMEGKKRMDADAFLRGYQIEEGTFFGN